MRLSIALALAAVLGLTTACSKTPKTDVEKASYSIGSQIGGNLARVKDQVEIGSVTEGLKDKVAGKKSRLSEEENSKAMADFQKAMGAGPGAAVDKKLKDQAGYAIGTQIGGDLARIKEAIDISYVVQGIKDQATGKKPKLTQEEQQAVMQAYQPKIQAIQAEKAKADGEKNLKEGAAFLEKNKANPKVKITKSGLQYEVLAEGKGPKPRASATVSVNYRGTLIDGVEFDSSYKRGQPATFPVKGVIPGWTEILQMMNVGSKYKVTIPGALAYGERGAGGQIGPNAVLVFEIELLSIQK